MQDHAQAGVLVAVKQLGVEIVVDLGAVALAGGVQRNGLRHAKQHQRLVHQMRAQVKPQARAG